jgi:hypothetical protein
MRDGETVALTFAPVRRQDNIGRRWRVDPAAADGRTVVAMARRRWRNTNAHR